MQPIDIDTGARRCVFKGKTFKQPQLLVVLCSQADTSGSFSSNKVILVASAGIDNPAEPPAYRQNVILGGAKLSDELWKAELSVGQG